jgi:hypothetical protein
MNITIKNGKLYGNAITDLTHRVELDELTLANLQQNLCPEKPPCWILSDNIYSSYCGIDKAPCNGNTDACHMLKKWEERVRVDVRNKARESGEMLKRAMKENELPEIVQAAGQGGAIG